MSTLPTLSRDFFIPFKLPEIVTFFILILGSNYSFSQQKVGVNTTSPQAGLHIVSDHGILATGVHGLGTVQDTGAGTRLMWIPFKGAFRFGTLSDTNSGVFENIWDQDSIGNWSFAGGLNTKALGAGAFSFGNQNSAYGESSIALGGKSNLSLGTGSFTTGSGNTAFSSYETVIGSFATLYSANDPTGFDGSDRVFRIGIGTSSLRKDALTVFKNGKVGIGTTSPLEKLHVVGGVMIDGGRIPFTNSGQSVFIGKDAGLNDNLSNNNSVFIGHHAGKSNTSGNDNIAIGAFALDDAAASHYNIAVGEGVLSSPGLNGSFNIGIGNFAVQNNTIGQGNIALGQNSLGQNTTGAFNISIGNYSSDASVSGNDNTVIGIEALGQNTTGNSNVSIGNYSSAELLSGSTNTAIGYEALKNVTTKGANVAIGYRSQLSATGKENVAIGQSAGRIAAGDGNVFIGHEAGFNETGSGKLYIDNGGTATPLIYGNFSTNKVIINDSLTSKYFQMTNGGGLDKVLVSDENGKAEWKDPSTFISNEWNLNGENLHNTNTENVGIGTNDPQEKLHIAGNTRVDGTLQITYFQMENEAGVDKVLKSDENGNGIWTDPAAFINHDWSLNGDHLYNTNPENVGIGTSDPARKLHIVGDVRIDGGKIETVNNGGSIFIGNNAGQNDDLNDNRNIFIGDEAGYSNTSGDKNSIIGTEAFKFNSTGVSNVAMGNEALRENTSGDDNIALGNSALPNNTTGDRNISFGSLSLISNTVGSDNIAIGFEAGQTVTGSGNTILGSKAGKFANGSGNVFLGTEAGYDESGNNKLYVDNTPTGTPLIYGDFSTNHLTINDSLTSKYFQMTNGAGSNKILQSNANGHATWVDPSSVFLDDWSASGNNIYNNNTSNVGIGTSAPSDKLHLLGHLKIETGRINFSNATSGTYVGEEAGLNDLTSGVRVNTFIGWRAGKLNSTGGENTVLGGSAFTSNTTGSQNVAIGNGALDSNVSGHYNIGLGYSALQSNLTGLTNIAIGYFALNNTIGNYNIGIGDSAGNNNSTGSNNIFLGTKAGYFETGSNKLYIDNTNTSTPLIYGDFFQNKITINDSLQTKYFKMTNGAANKRALQSDANGKGSWVKPHLLFEDTINVNIFLGSGVGGVVTSATDNTIIGSYAGEDLQSGYENTGFGKWSLQNITSATLNTAIGHNTLSANVSGSGNTALGWSALAGATGASNVAMGVAAGGENTSGSENVFIGTESGLNNSGSRNVFLGHNSGENESGSDKLIIDNSNTTTPLIKGDFSTNEVTINDSLTVGKELGVATSTPKSTFEVNGSLAAKFKTPLVAGTTNPDDTGMVWRYNTGTGTITLPGAGTCANRIYVIINQTGSTRTISTYRDLVTNNQTTLGSSQALWLMSDGSEWWQIK